MGMLVGGRWRDERAPRTDERGGFVRSESSFRNRVTADGSSGFEAEAGRYHLYVNRGCPWAYRTLLYRRLMGLEEAISLSATLPAMGKEGWEFGEGPGCTPDPIHEARWLHQVYTAADPAYTGRVTVPVLWDRESATIVNNESSEIIRMLNCEFDAIGNDLDFYPEPWRDEIDELNDYVYERVNNGVYRVGFALTQEAYDAAFERLFEGLDALEERLDGRRYLVGDRISEADWRLFATLVRFDAAYYTQFRCNRNRLGDFRNLWAYTRDLWAVPGVGETVDLDHIKGIYFGGATNPDPRRILPRGPALDFRAPHDRDRLGPPDPRFS
jgi:putative glutathione S-transferase